MSNREDYESPEYKRWRWAVLSRDDFTCLLPKSKVLMHDYSLKAIESISAGDMVIDKNGDVQRVLATRRKSVNNESIYAISKIGMKDTLYCTEDHKILCKNSNGDLSFKEAKDIKDIKNNPGKGDFLCEPIIKIKRPNVYVDYIFIYDFIDKKYMKKSEDSVFVFNSNTKHKKIKNQICVNANLGFLVGLFLAEGCLHKNHITFTFNIKENYLFEKCKRLLKDIFDVDSSIKYYKEKNTVRVYCCSSIVKRFFEKLCYLNKEKRIVNKDMPECYLKGLWDGIVQGDGYIKDDIIRIEMSRPDLIDDIYIISNMIGLRPQISGIFTRPDGRIIKKCSFHINKENSNVCIAKEDDSKYFHCDNKYIYSRLRELKSSKYSGYVYDIEIENTNSFVANFIVVHNCQLTGVKGGELEVHHIVPWAKAEHLRYAVSNGITLDKNVHQKVVTGNEDKYEKQFKEIVVKNSANYLNKGVSGKSKGKTSKPKKRVSKWRKRNPRLRY